MKKLLLIGAVAFLASCAAQPESGYTVNVTATGDLTQLPNDTILLNKGTRLKPVNDTLVLVGGKAELKGETATPNYVSLTFKGERRAFATLFLENAKYNVTFDAAAPADAVVEGGATQTFINELNAKQKEVTQTYKLDSIMKLYQTATAEEREKIMEVYETAQNEVTAVEEAYLAANPASNYALVKLSQGIGQMSFEEAVVKIAPFDTLPAFANNQMYKDVKAAVELMKSLQPGNKAPDFVQNDPDGNPIKFSDIYSKNKVTMIDFWASWCGPCRAFNPELVKIYKKFHNKGFEILGVSNDRDKEAWLKGIKDDKLTWPQVSDLKFWDNEVGKLYYVRYIPQNIFVDQNGIIIGRQVEKQNIEKLLEENLNK